MSHDVNLADPSFEPTDDDLRQLSREAFADVPAQQREALARLRREVTALRAEALAHLAALDLGGASRGPTTRDHFGDWNSPTTARHHPDT